jgi:phage host-nuclease inhibitor protein Gam
MAQKVTRLKTPAQDAPQTRDDVARQIRQIGDLQRDFSRESTAMNDAIGEITQRHQPALASLMQRIEALQTGVQTWCEAHRNDLTNGGKVKTANLITGEIQWRQRPPSVRIRAQEVVIETLERLGFGRFVRVKKEINKEAILADTAAVEDIVGISIASGIEDFVITPFEQDLNNAA